MKSDLRILHLEDNPVDAELIRSLLDKEGIPAVVHRVETEEAFRSALNPASLDLILSDLSLPSFDGLAALAIARKGVPDIPFLFVSGTMGEDAAITSLVNGATDYVLKGKLDRLAPAVRRAIAEVEETQRRKRAEEALRESELSFRLLFMSNPQPMWVYERRSLRFLEVNAAATTQYGYTRDEFLRMKINDIRPPEEIPRLMADLAKSRDAIDRTRHWLHRLKDGTIIEVDIISHLLVFAGKEASLVVAQNVTEQLKAQRASALFRALIDSATDSIEVMDPKTGRLLDVNQRECQELGYERKELLSMTVFDISPTVEPTEFFKGESRFSQANPRGMIIQGMHRRKDGSTFPVEVNLNYLVLDQPYIVAVSRDITERVKKEAELRASLSEKDLLLKEIHHRVKNNLQIVSSLLNLQVPRITDPEAKAVFKESMARIRSIALVHDKLYRSGNLAHVDMRNFLASLLEELLKTYGREGITGTVEGEPIVVGIDIAIPCGLIANELVVNALLHAFSGRQQGKLVISFDRVNETSLSMFVQDDGIGVKGGEAARGSESSGLGLVMTLVEQIGGTLHIEEENGMRTVVAFPG